MKGKSLLVLCGLLVGCSACMGQTRPAPDTSPMPVSASIAEHSGVEARRLEAERRTGVIFETSQPGQVLVDGQPPSVELPAESATELEGTSEKQPESSSTEQGGVEQDGPEPKNIDVQDDSGDVEESHPDNEQIDN